MEDGRPKVTVLTPTYNRPDYLPMAIRSVIDQDMNDWEMLVVNDGGTDVGGIVASFDDERIKYFNRERNTGKATCLNFAIKRSNGQYLAYLDDDDRWYPAHIRVLSDCLDNNPDIVAAYSDLYANTFLQADDGTRVPLGKSIDISRDFNRLFMFWYNHVLHVSVMHRKEVVLRTGGYNEDVSVLIDWSMNRKLAFYGDFMRVPIVTGEYFTRPKGMDSDRISDLQRKDKENYKHNLNRIRGDNPPKPWPKVHEVAVIYKPTEWDSGVIEVVKAIIENAHYPCDIYLCKDYSSQNQGSYKGNTDLLADFANVHTWSCPESEDPQVEYSALDEEIGADYYCVIDSSIEEKMKDVPLATLVKYAEDQKMSVVCWPFERDKEGPNGVLLRSEAFARLNESPLKKSWPDAVTVPKGTIPPEFLADCWLSRARKLEANGDYRGAKKIVEKISRINKGGLGNAYLAQTYARLAFKVEDYSTATEVCKYLVQNGYGAENYVYLGEIFRRQKSFRKALRYYEKAWEQRDLTEEHIESDVFPLASKTPCQAFTIVMGMAESYLELGNLPKAAHYARIASRLSINNVRPSMAFGRIFIKSGDLARASQAYQTVLKMTSGKDAADAHFQLARVARKHDDLEQAWAHCRSALGEFAGHTEAAELASGLSRNLEVDTDVLKDLLETYLEYHPGNPAVLRRLSEIYRQEGRLEEALDLEEKASVLDRAVQNASATAAE